MPDSRYREMDKAEIDRQLNLRARWPEHDAYFKRWASDSAAARARLEGRLDLAYGAAGGETGGQTLDLFPDPARSEPTPLLAFIHGGYWQGLDKGDFTYLAPAFIEAGIAFASINYDLAPKVGVGEIVGQVLKAIAWLAAEGPAHGIDPERIFVAGHSAGGHLAALAMAMEPVKGGCSISGIYELEVMRLSYHQEVLNLDPETVRSMSPLRNLPERAGPLICAVGSEETEEFLRQQDEMVAAWRGRGLDARVVDLPGRNHFSAVDALGDTRQPLFAAVRDLALGEG
jgi:arylformamidase